MSNTATLDPRAEAVALPDLGLMLGALTLARLASVYDPPGLEVGL